MRFGIVFALMTRANFNSIIIERDANESSNNTTSAYFRSRSSSRINSLKLRVSFSQH